MTYQLFVLDTILAWKIEFCCSSVGRQTRSHTSPFWTEVGTIKGHDDGMVDVGIQTAAAVPILNGHFACLIIVVRKTNVYALLVEALVRICIEI